MRGLLIVLALIAPLTQTVLAANPEELRGQTEQLWLSAQSGAVWPGPSLSGTAGIPAVDVERQAVLASILEEAGIFAGTAGAGGEAGLLRNYLRSPRAAAGTARFSVIDAIWALGELKDGAAAPVLAGLLSCSDYTVRLNILSALEKINAAAPGTVLGLGKADYSAIPPGDLLFRKGIFGIFNPAIPVGHTAIFMGMENGTPMVIHSISPGGTDKATMAVFIAQKPYYGNRTTVVPPTAGQRAEILSWLGKQIGKPYDTLHSTQKGPDKLDCVGLTEAAYEYVGLNPTPDKLELGAGWPLEPYEQYDHTVAAPVEASVTNPGSISQPALIPYGTYEKRSQ